jgi:lysophospholipase L1-like esterase
MSSLRRLGTAALFLTVFACSTADDAGSNGAGAGGASTMDAATGGTGGDTSTAGAGGSTSGSAGSSGSGGSAGSGSPSDAASEPPDDLDASASDAGDRGAVADVAADDRPDAPTDASFYDPCPPKGTPCRIMPMGDSITRRYRPELFHQALAHGQSITFVGSVVQAPDGGPDMVDGVPFPPNYEGYSGYTIPRILMAIQNADSIKTYKPDIVLLEAGTNGGLRGDSGTAASRELVDLAQLVDYILGQDSHLFLIVAQITPLADDTWNAHVKMFNAGIPDLVKTRAAAGKHIGMVDAFTPFMANPNWKTELIGSDLIHPTDDKGFPLLGDIWYGAVAGYLR